MKKLTVISNLVILVIVLSQCAKTNRGVDSITSFTALPLVITSPADNPQTIQKITLGKLLFWDPVLSGTKEVACGSCHHSSMGYTDNLDLSIGVNGQGLGTSRHFLLPNNIPFVKRNSMTILNTAFNGLTVDGTYDPLTAVMFFDNRTHSLESQSLEPIKTMEEMRGGRILVTNILDSVILRLKNIPEYTRLFSEAFQTADAVTAQNLARAIASFERTLISNHSPYDEYIRGNTLSMTQTQIQGMNAFAVNGCNNCHSGPMFSDFSLHVLSVPDNSKLPVDAGTNGTYAFRTPSLRNLTLTAPYMHNGMLPSLNAVLDFYEQVGDHHSQNPHVGNNQLDPELKRINDRDKGAIIEFLSTLSDDRFDKTIPISVPSGLHPGGNL